MLALFPTARATFLIMTTWTRALLIFLFTGAVPTATHAQSFFTSTEVGVMVGTSQYFGDLNDRYAIRTLGPAGGIYARKHMNNYISLKGGALYTQVSFDDKYSRDAYHVERNLNFKSDILELTFQAEFNFFRFVTGNPYHRVTPYLTGGFGAFYYNPYTTYKGEKVFLRPQGTEGQYAGYEDRKYTNFSPCFPIGLGVKMWLKPGMNLTIELTDRLTTTDYLDDVSSTYVGASRFTATPMPISYYLQDRSIEVSPNKPLGRPGKQRGNTSSYDQYMMLMVSFSWHFTTYKCPSSESFDLIKTY